MLTFKIHFQSDLVIDPTLPILKLGIDITRTNILTKFLAAEAKKHYLECLKDFFSNVV